MYKKVMTVASVIIAMMLIVTCMKSNANGADAGQSNRSCETGV
jgi:hypothetical protein